MHDKKPKQIHVVSEQELKEDMEKYRQLAIEKGMTDAKVIPAEKVYVDRRARIKCIIPKCRSYGVCAHCPPHSPDTSVFIELVSCYRYALLVKLNVDPNLMLDGVSLIIDEKGKIQMSQKVKDLLKQYRKVSDTVTDIESQAFYDGHYFAVALSAGSCRGQYCNFQDCAVLKGLPCRFPGRARPSMESSSIDVYRMVAEAGWEMYPIGTDCNPANVPHGTLVGLVLIE